MGLQTVGILVVIEIVTLFVVFALVAWGIENNDATDTVKRAVPTMGDGSCCPHCGTENDGFFDYCSNCTAPLGGSSA